MGAHNVYLKKLSLVMVSLFLGLVLCSAVLATISQSPLFLLLLHFPVQQPYVSILHIQQYLALRQYLYNKKYLD